MAIENNVQPQVTSTGRNQRDAEAWLNLRVKDSSGNWHNIRGFIPLTSDNNVHKALMVKGAASEDGTPVEIELIGTVNFVKNEEIIL
ncbi:MAG: hypothetical protein ACRCR2_02550 [Fusobacteriaceae bacterium]